jgi:hypothetical protein
MVLPSIGNYGNEDISTRNFNIVLPSTGRSWNYYNYFPDLKEHFLVVLTAILKCPICNCILSNTRMYERYKTPFFKLFFSFFSIKSIQLFVEMKTYFDQCVNIAKMPYFSGFNFFLRNTVFCGYLPAKVKGL